MFPFSGLRGILYGFALGAILGGLAIFKVMLWHIDALENKAIKQSLKVERAIVKDHYVVQEKLVEKIKYIRLKGETIVKEIPVYVTKEDESKCTLNNGFVRVFDSAILHRDPGPPADSDRGPSDVSLLEVAGVSAQNAASFEIINSKLDACIAAYNVVKDKVNATNPR